MGCSICSAKKNSKIFIEHKQSKINITPGTFIRLNKSQHHHDYVELQKLGSGAFAQVTLCYHKPTKTQRAVKIIHKSGLSQSQKDPKYLLKEVHIFKELDHPSIIKCFEIFQDNRVYYVATEYCPGGDLFSEISKLKKLKESQVADVMSQLLSALVYCHEKRVIHRDLKPENILLMESGEKLSIKVADFGSSAFLDPDARLSGCYGSVYYLAPEVFKKKYDEKCDIWSVGIIMYVLLTGRPPYSGRDQSKIYKKVKTSPFVLTPSRASGISEPAVDLLRSLLSIDPKKRISARSALQHKWIQDHRNNLLTDTELVLSGLKSFHCHSKLKAAVYIFIASQIESHEDLKYFKDCFMKLDLDGDGKLTKEELVYEYSKSMPFEKAEDLTKYIISKIDQNSDGKIEYTEFLVSCREIQKNISLDELECAFKMFDIDGNGEISADELRFMLDEAVADEEEVWRMLMKEADTNRDGKVDLREFINMMGALKSVQSSNSNNAQSFKSFHFSVKQGNN